MSSNRDTPPVSQVEPALRLKSSTSNGHLIPEPSSDQAASDEAAPPVEPAEERFTPVGAALPHGRRGGPKPRLADGSLLLNWRAPAHGLRRLPDDLHLSPFGPLEAKTRRTPCPGCGKSHLYFCYDCVQPLTEHPRVQLAISFDVVYHRDERRSNSTGVHAALLAAAPPGGPGGAAPPVRLFRPGEALPAYDPATAAVLYPSPHAGDAAPLVASGRLQRVVVIEAKWKGSKTLVQHPALKHLPHMRLPPAAASAYWRYHTRRVTPAAVSTIEAIHHLCQISHRHGDGGGCQESTTLAADSCRPASAAAAATCHCFDDLLWYFAFLHGIVEAT